MKEILVIWQVLLGKQTAVNRGAIFVSAQLYFICVSFIILKQDITAKRASVHRPVIFCFLNHSCCSLKNRMLNYSALHRIRSCRQGLIKSLVSSEGPETNEHQEKGIERKETKSLTRCWGL